jgi:FAD-NAD(P)-binding
VTNANQAVGPPDASVATVVIIGAGPRGAGLLERLCANAPELFGERRLDVHIVDPHPFGSGQIWRSGQSPLLWANSQAGDMTMFTDSSCTIEGPIRPGPDMSQWAAIERQATIQDDALEAELQALSDLSFPSRRLVNEYLSWTFRQTARAAPEQIAIRMHPDQAVDLTDEPDGRQLVSLKNTDQPLIADVVLLALGHLPTQPLGPSIEIADFATRHELAYLPENYAADADLEAFGPGDDVLVSGFGLAFIDLMVLLTEGRGGRYLELDGGRLRYQPSGREPHLYVGSRRGVPYRSKLTYHLQADRAPHPRFLGPPAVDNLLALPRAVDFQADVWPLLVKELLFGYYHELFLGHPDQVRMSWAEFEAGLAEAGSDRSDFDRLLARAVPDPADRFDLAGFDRPLRDRKFQDADELQNWTRAHIEADLARRSDPRFSADLGLFNALLAVLGPVGRLLGSGRIAVRSQLVDLPRFLGLFSYLASGPPPRRLHELLALSEAGLVTFLGADAKVRPFESGADAGFVAASPSVPGQVRASALIEARVPRPSIARSTDPLVEALYAQGALGEEKLPDAESGRLIGTGRLQVTADCRMVDAAGRTHPRRYAFGAWTSAATPAAFSRPWTDAPFFRQNDAAARGVLSLLREQLAATDPEPSRQAS